MSETKLPEVHYKRPAEAYTACDKMVQNLGSQAMWKAAWELVTCQDCLKRRPGVVHLMALGSEGANCGANDKAGNISTSCKVKDVTCPDCKRWIAKTTEADKMVKQSDLNAFMEGIDERLEYLEGAIMNEKHPNCESELRAERGGIEERLEKVERALLEQLRRSVDDDFHIKISTALSIIGASELSKTADKDSKLYKAAELFLLEQVFHWEEQS